VVRLPTTKFSGWWKDTGHPEDILEANRLVLKDLKTSIGGMIEHGVTVAGEVEVGEGTMVHCVATLRGSIVIDDHSEIGFGGSVDSNTCLGSRV